MCALHRLEYFIISFLYFNLKDPTECLLHILMSLIFKLLLHKILESPQVLKRFKGAFRMLKRQCVLIAEVLKRVLWI